MTPELRAALDKVIAADKAHAAAADTLNAALVELLNLAAATAKQVPGFTGP